LSNSCLLGSSVAWANEANESIIRFIQSNWMGYKGDSFKIQAPTNAVIKATTFTVS